ncbi:protein NRT1/ PTR FAMILY 5.6-like [Chenopodium quinoa]|uniref:protein NRT1/ PTR FAMILY 5.6-like n=1 Tax=Chenopodium quinoa TaxID=63459 RepID=UPI000B776E9F|nr:protein NRT1/ PTR FAMILY 5.6-like [Chenopodium quinoa]
MEGRGDIHDETQREKGDDFRIPKEKIDENGMELHVHDSTLDYKGKLPIRASTGSWKASYFMIGIEFSERMSHFTILTNMITYMTDVMHQDLETAANNVNIWGGVVTVTPMLGGFLADAYTGGYFMILFAAILYALVLSLDKKIFLTIGNNKKHYPISIQGLGVLTMSQYIPSLKPCDATSTTCDRITKVHELVFYLGIYLVALATGGHKPCTESFGADQFDYNHTEERIQKISFFNWWNISICGGYFIGVTVIVYVQDNVSWALGFLILAIVMGVSVLVFFLGRPYYRYKTALGSPLTPLLQVLVAAVAKRNLVCPSNPSLLYEDPNSRKLQGQCLDHTNRLRFLDKAAIIENHESNGAAVKKQSPWRLATVTQVEELKLIVTMIPIWLNSLVFGIGVAQGPSFFVKQGSAMNRKIYKEFEIPAASMTAFIALGLIITVALYDKVLVPYLRRVIGNNERGINILTRISVGMVALTISILISALVEKKRLKASLEGKIMNIFWLTPQFFILGVGDGLSLVGMQEYFYEQVPNSMRSIGMAFYLSVIGIGSFLNSFLIIIVNHATKMHGGKKWIGKDLSHSRLDYYYWLLMIIIVLNMCLFMLLSRNYRYKSIQKSVVVDGEKKLELSTV